MGGRIHCTDQSQNELIHGWLVYKGMNGLIYFGLFLVALAGSGVAEARSQCHGSTASGHINNAVQLPKQGKNFQVFSELAWYLGRTYVHSDVAQAILQSFKSLQQSHPDKVFMYAETGWPQGGLFKPHKTHQNGLSVDFMVPVLDAKQQSVHLPIKPSNKLGYGLEFDATGQYQAYRIDFAAMAAHLASLIEAAQDLGFGIKKVYFDPRFQGQLLATKQGDLLARHIQFNQRPAWVRHDEHYHVDFDISCQ